MSNYWRTYAHQREQIERLTEIADRNQRDRVDGVIRAVEMGYPVDVDDMREAVQALATQVMSVSRLEDVFTRELSSSDQVMGELVEVARRLVEASDDREAISLPSSFVLSEAAEPPSMEGIEEARRDMVRLFAELAIGDRDGQMHVRLDALRLQRKQRDAGSDTDVE